MEFTKVVFYINIYLPAIRVQSYAKPSEPQSRLNY